MAYAEVGMTKYARREEVRARDRRWALMATTLLVAFLLWQDHRSLERGNRLYRAGDPPAAAEVYRAWDRKGDGLPTAQYNLGTALLHIDADSAEAHLRRATEGKDRTTAQRGFYNLGYHFLTALQGSLNPDSTMRALTGAVESNRAALRLHPTDESARWNLALAQRRLDALVPPGEATARESSGSSADELAIDEQSLARSETADAVSGLEPEDPRLANNSGERQGAREGARETWASQDPGPLTRTVAFGLLETVDDEPESLIKGILWSHRPDIAWWGDQPYPGGGW